MPHETFSPRRVINAWGTATPFGVSRSDEAIAQAASAMLQRYALIEELQAEAGRRIARWSGAQAGCVTHCTAAAITLSVAACMAGTSPQRVAQLPGSEGMPSRVLLLAAHAVHYGQAITQAVRLAGATPVLCPSLDAMHAALAAPGAACVLAVESHLAAGSGSGMTRDLARLAQMAGVPLVLDGAAQDWRVGELVGSGAALVLVSAQKYLGAPTAGLVLGRTALVAAVDAQHAGIGRAMKPSKEALAGVIAALELREAEDAGGWRAAQQRKLDQLAQAASQWQGVQARREPDPQGNGFDRLWLAVDPTVTGFDAAFLVQRLRGGEPVVAVAPHRVAQGQIGLELTGVDEAEVAQLCELLGVCFKPV